LRHASRRAAAVRRSSPILEEQKIAAKQLRALPQNAPLAAMIVDYKKMRDACRASGS
jgi:hypothetical protein